METSASSGGFEGGPGPLEAWSNPLGLGPRSPGGVPLPPDDSPEAGFHEGFLIGILVGEGHFGGDGKQPHVTLRMHTRHAAIFSWLEQHYPGGRVYGPYTHGGRNYLQWMARGPFLRDVLRPILDRRLTPALDAHAHERYLGMKARYPAAFPREPGCEGPPSRTTPTT